MTTHVANIQITHAKAVDLADDKAVKNVEKHGVQDAKTINPGERFSPADLGLTAEQTEQMVKRGQIREATDKDPEKGTAPPEMTVRGNETEGSGATRRGTSQVGPPGIDMAKDAKATPAPIKSGPLPPGTAGAP